MLKCMVCCCKEETGQLVEVMPVVSDDGSTQRVEVTNPTSDNEATQVARSTSRISTTSRASQRISCALHESIELDSDPTKMNDDTPMETMQVVQQLSRKLSGQIGIDVETLYASGDHDVIATDDVILKCLSQEDLNAALEKVVDATEALLPKGQMTEYQRSWCIPKTVQIYLDDRDGDVGRAAETLALALIWRENNKEVLQGNRIPKWTGDMRVLTRGVTGHPLIYGCYANQARFPDKANTMESIGLVMATALEAMRGDAMTFDFVLDCHGFRVSSNLDPRIPVGLMEMLKHPFRGRLRSAWLVDAPKAFSMCWNFASPHMAEKVRKVVKFVKRTEAPDMIAAVSGSDVAHTVREIMAANRSQPSATRLRIEGLNMPSELKE